MLDRLSVTYVAPSPDGAVPLHRQSPSPVVTLSLSTGEASLDDLFAFELIDERDHLGDRCVEVGRDG